MKFESAHTIIIAAVISTAAILLSCSNNDDKNHPDIGIRDSLPVLMSVGVSSTVSDSGIISYKIISEDWYYYDKKDPTYHAFEKGLFLEKFDKSLHVVAFISCDTAYHFDRKKLWELRGRVLVKNLKGETFKTSLLYWDMGSHRIYSDQYMEIDGENQQLSGYNFSSNEMMTDYIIHSSKGAFPLEEDNPEPIADPNLIQNKNTNIIE
ncbi:MAG: LPS export ABC transporter periplasmic protein LptC [Bacteroidaceae bacterium]|nr:LPS export ABC transporter periplasmic protein LptC [Bacteroidaceae bacterium]